MNKKIKLKYIDLSVIMIVILKVNISQFESLLTLKKTTVK